MLLHGPSSPPLFNKTPTHSVTRTTNYNHINFTCCRANNTSRLNVTTVGLLAASIVMASSVGSAVEDATQQDGDTFSNVPQVLSGECLEPKDCKKARIQKPKSRKAESCTTKCVGTCIRGGEGSPGEGPFNIRGPLVVFKNGFRSRKYCLVECSDICNLIGDGDDGP